MRYMLIVATVFELVPIAALAQVEPSARELPRWRGFNLLEMFQRNNSPGPFKEQDFGR